MTLKVGKALGRTEDLLVYTPDPKWVIPNQKIGIEIELESVMPNSIKPVIHVLWETHSDDSLRGNGCEFTTRGGLFGKDLTASLDTFFANTGKNWTISERTGLHIHTDITDLDIFPDLANLCIMYAVFEKPLFMWVGDSRDSNINCLPWQKAQGDLKLIASLISPQTKAPQFQNAVADIQRYSALNLAALNKFGTLEWRHMQSTLDRNRIETWINILMSIKKAAKTTKFHTFQELMDHIESDPVAFFESIFGDLTGQFRSNGNIHHMMMDGMATAYDLAFLYQEESVTKLAQQTKTWEEVDVTEEASIQETPLMRYLTKHKRK